MIFRLHVFRVPLQIFVFAVVSLGLAVGCIVEVRRCEKALGRYFRIVQRDELLAKYEADVLLPVARRIGLRHGFAREPQVPRAREWGSPRRTAARPVDVQSHGRWTNSVPAVRSVRYD